MAKREIFRNPDLKGLEKYKPKNLIWKNIIYMDMMTVVFFILLIILILSYKHDTKQCFELLENPCEFVDQYQCTGETLISEFSEKGGIYGINITSISGP